MSPSKKNNWISTGYKMRRQPRGILTSSFFVRSKRSQVGVDGKVEFYRF